MKGRAVAIYFALASSACRPALPKAERRRLAALLGVTQGELSASATDGRLRAIGEDLQAPDALRHELGEVECTLLQVRAKALGREAALLLPLLAVDRDQGAIDRVSGDLSGLIQCDSLYNAVRLGPRLRQSVEEVGALLSRHRPRASRARVVGERPRE